MTHHPHLHVIVPGGGRAADGSAWVAAKPGFFLPVRVLSTLFRRLMLAKLAAAHAAGKLQFFGEHRRLGDADAFAVSSRRSGQRGGSSTPRGPSPDRRRCSPISRATPTASRSPTAA
jgi:hypothetical protein